MQGKPLKRLGQIIGRVLTRLKPGENEKSVVKYTLDYLDEVPDLSSPKPEPELKP